MTRIEYSRRLSAPEFLTGFDLFQYAERVVGKLEYFAQNPFYIRNWGLTCDLFAKFPVVLNADTNKPYNPPTHFYGYRVLFVLTDNLTRAEAQAKVISTAYKLIVEFEEHERGEFFRFHGFLVNDPHKNLGNREVALDPEFIMP